jgi:HEAT repeat protein
MPLCGHTHRTNFNEFNYPGFHLPIVSAGSLCAGPRQREESIPRLYNLITIKGDSVRVHTRSRETKDLPWTPYARWGSPPCSYFDVRLIGRPLPHRSGTLAKSSDARDNSKTGDSKRKSSFEEQYKSLERIVSNLHQDGYEVSVDDQGIVIIGDGFMSNTRMAGNSIRQLQAEIALLREAIIGHEPTEAELDLLEARYRQHIIRWVDRLTFQGMMRTGRPISLPLEDIFVDLCAVAEVPEAADIFSVEERRLLLEAEDKEPGLKRELMRHMDVLRRERWNVKLPERRTIRESLFKDSRRAFVILGDPGSGKTTLLHLLALAYAKGPTAVQRILGATVSESNRLPIFVPLAAYDDMRQRFPGLSLIDFLALYYDRRRGLPGLAVLFKRALESGRALVLLDGLDEVLDSVTRGLVAEQTGALIGEWTGRGVRFAVTSRFVGYREAPLGGDLPHLSLLDFRLPEIELFVRRWTLAFEQWAADSDTATPEILRKAHEHEADLLGDVRSNPGVQRLAANPLMLTMLALLRRQVGRLPHRRIKLYESYVMTLIENWMEARSYGAREQSVKMLDPHNTERILIPLAFWLQEDKPSGTANKAELRKALIRIHLEEIGVTLSNATRLQLGEAEDKAERFLHDMRYMTGLIVERGQDAFGFLHLTFQEYFAGRAIARADDSDRWRMMQPHLHDPRWREPILLCSGQLGVVEQRRGQVSELVRRIISCQDETESDLHRNLLLAMAIAADDVSIDPGLLAELVKRAKTCLNTKIPALASQIARCLAQLVVNNLADPKECFDEVLSCKDKTVHEPIIQALAEFLSNQPIKDLILAILNDEDEDSRVEAARVLSGAVGTDPQVRDALLARLNDGSWNVSQVAASALSGAVGSDTQVRDALLARLNDRNEYVHLAAIRALSGAAGVDARVRDALSVLLEDKNVGIRMTALNALSKTAGTDEQVRETLLKLLDDESSHVRRAAAKALSGAVGNEVHVRDALLARLDDESVDIRRAAAIALSGAVGNEVHVRDALFARLDDESADIRQAAAIALSAAVEVDVRVRNALLAHLDDESGDVRAAVANALSVLVGSNRQVQGAVATRLRDDYWEVRQAVSQCLGDALSSLGETRELADQLASSLYCLEDRGAAVNFASEYYRIIGRLVGIDTQVREAMFARLDDRSWYVRQAAVSALTGVIGTDVQVRDALFARLDDEDGNVRQAAANALSETIASDVRVRDILVAGISDEHWNIRHAAANTLSKKVQTDVLVRDALLGRLKDKGEHIREAAASALSKSARTDALVRDALLGLLDDRDESVRQAAATALSEAAQNDALVCDALLARLDDKNESILDAAAKALSGAVQTNVLVRDSLLARLDYKNESVFEAAATALSGTVQTDIMVRDALLARMDDENWIIRQAVASALSGAAGTDAQVRDALLARLNDEDDVVRMEVVNALSGAVGSNAHVRDALLFRLDDESWFVRQAAVTAISLLDTQEIRPGELSRVKEWLVADRSLIYIFLKSANNEIELLAHHIGIRLPDDSSLRDWVFEHLASPSISARLGAVMALTDWKGGPPADVVQKVLAALDDHRDLASYPARLTAASYLINRDPYSGQAVNICLEALDYGTQPWENLERSEETRKQAALILGKLEPTHFDSRVYDRLRDVLYNDGDVEVRNAAYATLVRLAGIRERLSKCLPCERID